MNVSLVYNNKKLIGKCSKFAIEKVQGTSPFVMLENFEPKQPQLNENQQIVLECLKEMIVAFDICNAIYRLESAEAWGKSEEHYDIAYESLNDKERLQVVQVACQWALEQEAE